MVAPILVVGIVKAIPTPANDIKQKRNRKKQDEIDKLNKKVELEQEEKTKLAQQKQNTDDPAEKRDEKVDNIYQGFDDNLSQEQFVAESNSIN
ncbi:9867_t:CDS:2 [Entrophospora sp. SA101]|nr:9867_t:CDS:2 [Entrophospora sp. SA101]